MTDLSYQSMRLAVYDGQDLTAPISLPDDELYFVYVQDGRATLQSSGEVRRLSADEGAFVQEGATLENSGSTWIFEVAGEEAPFLSESGLILAHLARPDFPRPFLVRADRIESEPGARTPRHGHRGPGLRRLIFGRLLAEVGAAVERIKEGGAWFESGKDPVVGTNIGPTNAAFVRVMVLPAELEGGSSSFVPCDEAEARKPRAVQNKLFGEILV